MRIAEARVDNTAPHGNAKAQASVTHLRANRQSVNDVLLDVEHRGVCRLLALGRVHQVRARQERTVQLSRAHTSSRCP